jgi:hypothetical protein
MKAQSRLRFGAIAALAIAGSVVIQAAPAFASQYQDLYSLSCGAAYVRISSNTTGSVEHWRNGSLSTSWSGNATKAYHWDYKYHSVSSSSVETYGSSAWVYTAQGMCYHP